MTGNKQLLDVIGEWVSHARHGQIEISGLRVDSREVEQGDLFLAYPGQCHDGRDYIGQALQRGAAAVAYDPGDFTAAAEGIAVPVPQLRYKLGLIAERFYDWPSQQLFIVGITGTNGKTSCAYLLAQAFERLGHRCGLIGTLGWGFVSQLRATDHTTPEPITLHRELRRLLDDGASHVCLEVSSHALDQGRVAGVGFDGAIFTNISRDHLDYHRDFDDYAAAKAKLFDFPELEFRVINNDDRLGRELVRRGGPGLLSYGNTDADLTPRSVLAEARGVTVVISSAAGDIKVRSCLIGKINIPNLLAVTAALLACEHGAEQISTALHHIGPVPGRMELFVGADGLPCVVVDYAHSPDALGRALRSVREHCRGRLWCVFGCGGDRDRGKRPMMGEIAETTADEVVLTDDNPRFEDPAKIVAEIRTGMCRRPHIIHDRVTAIRWTIEHADSDDWVLVAGKGHETQQQVGKDKLPLDDRKVVNECLLAA